jgi:hypothetical protein
MKKSKPYLLKKKSQGGLAKELKLTAHQTKLLIEANHARRTHAAAARKAKRVIDGILGDVGFGVPKKTGEQINLINGRKTIALVKPGFRQGYACKPVTFWRKAIVNEK